jgi:Tfp pilus assembly protein PilV
MKTIPRSQSGQTGFSLPEVMVASFILILVVLSSLQMTGSSILGMGRSKQRGLVDANIASHMETLREGAFRYLCTQGCANNELTKSLAFDLANLKPLCSANNLGQGLLNALPASAKPSTFIVNSVPPVEVRVAYTPSGNQLNVTFTAAAVPMSVSTTLVPHAQGWCP